MFARILIALIVVPIAEIWVMAQVAGFIGWPITIGVVLAVSVIGAWLVRRQGIGAWRRLQKAISSGSSPTKELVDGGLVIFGATLLLTPGFLTDALGLAMLIPLTRAPVRTLIIARVAVRARTMTEQYASARLGRTFGDSGVGFGWVRPGTVVDTDGTEASPTVDAEAVVVKRVDPELRVLDKAERDS